VNRPLKSLLTFYIIFLLISSYGYKLIDSSANSDFKNEEIALNNQNNKPISRSNSLIIDLNRETDYPHHNITYYGGNNAKSIGSSITSGDINGDSINDLIFSSKSDGPSNNRRNCGAVYVTFGNTIQTPVRYIESQYDMVVYGDEAYDRMGDALAVGDINNDEIQDIIISSKWAYGYNNGKIKSGEIYVLFGNSSLPTKWDLNKTSPNITIFGADSYDEIGHSITCGDINGDDIDDIIFSSIYADGPTNTRNTCGETYVIFGNESIPSKLNLSVSVNMTIYGRDSMDQMGESIATGDLNSDGYDDIVIGAHWADGFNNQLTNSGESYIIFGNSSDNLNDTIDLSKTKPNITVYGIDYWDYSGRTVATGNLNGDNYDDIIISSKADGINNNKLDCGEVYILYCNHSISSNLSLSKSNVTIYGKDVSDNIGLSLETGDSNFDNIEDLLIGTAWGGNEGKAYIFYGNETMPKTIDMNDPNQQPDIRILDDKYNTGDSAIFGDINGDNKSEIIITSPLADGRCKEQPDIGEIYIILSGGDVLPIPIIDSIILKNGDGDDKNICYAEYNKPYNFRIQVTTPNEINDIKYVELGLAYNKPSINLQIVWTRSTGVFQEIRDPNNFITISNLSNFYSNSSINSWTIDLFVIFNRSYPETFFHTVRAHVKSNSGYNDWLNFTSDIYRVENRFNIIGDLNVTSEIQGKLIEGDWIRGGEKITWSDIKIIYEGTTNIYPPKELGLFITISDSRGNNWSQKHEPFKKISINSSTINESKLNETYSITITGIPWYLDKSDLQFKLNIDADQVTFSNPIPEDDNWFTILNPQCGILISDNSTNINLSTIQYRITTDNGLNWSDWNFNGIQKYQNEKGVNCLVKPVFKEGNSNLIQWRATDVIGNPLNDSTPYKILIDISNVTFSNPKPLDNELQINKSVNCGITVTDLLSGVNASSIEFSTSTSDIWEYGDWHSAQKKNDSNAISCSVTPTFKEGTDNFIRWRAKDVVGNGYHVSDNYQIKIKLNKPPYTTLISPKNRSIIYTLAPELVWSTNDPDNDTALSHSIYLSTDKDQIIDLNKSALLKSNIVNQFFELDTQLEDNTTYYWAIIPFDGKTIGFCTSDFWEFRIQTTVTIPTCTLIEPINNTNISSTTPKLSWILNYFNSSIVTYNIYLAKVPVVGELISEKYMYQEDYKLTTFIVEKPLVRGETYYWTVIPIANHHSGKLEGICRSGQWKFKIELPTEHFYNISMEIESINLTVEQGGIITTNITIMNIGDTSDIIFLEINKGTLNANIAFEDSINKINLLKDEKKKVTLEIIVSPITTPKNYTIQITAESEKAKLDGKEVSVTNSIRLKVLEKAPEDQSKDDSEKQFGFWDMILWLVIILIIFILLVISIFVYKAKKDKEIPTVKAELMYKPPPHLALPEGETKGEEEILLPGAEEKIVPTLGGPGISTRYQLPKAVLTKKQELKLLREKFLLGEIDKETYKEMKNEIENIEDISAEDQDFDLKGKLPGQTKDIELEDNQEMEDIDQPNLLSEVEDLETMEQEEFEKTTEISVEEPVIDSELQDIPEEVYPFPDDGFCITCGQSLDSDMAYCWSCGTKYETLEE
jgi:hypothetical protein